jgi:hypothetical protein
MITRRDQIQTGTKMRRGRGKARASIELIQAAYNFLEQQNPTTIRGVCYALFTRGVIGSMETKNTQKVSRLLRDAREDGTIPWEWVVDETRALERVNSFRDPAQFVRAVRRSYRRDFWAQQPVRVEVWSEKGTIRGVLQPVLDDLGVGFRVMHGFGSTTSIYDVAQDYDGAPLIALYVGDWDPSGLYMSERDLPERLARYGGDHVTMNRIAVLQYDTRHLPSFPAATKLKDPRYKWFVQRYGTRCWELDAMYPNELRGRVEDAIRALIEPEAWERCEAAQEAEQESLRHLLDKWTAA